MVLQNQEGAVGTEQASEHFAQSPIIVIEKAWPAMSDRFAELVSRHLKYGRLGPRAMAGLYAFLRMRRARSELANAAFNAAIGQTNEFVGEFMDSVRSPTWPAVASNLFWTGLGADLERRVAARRQELSQKSAAGSLSDIESAQLHFFATIQDTTI